MRSIYLVIPLVDTIRQSSVGHIDNIDDYIDIIDTDIDIIQYHARYISSLGSTSKWMYPPVIPMLSGIVVPIIFEKNLATDWTQTMEVDQI